MSQTLIRLNKHGRLRPHVWPSLTHPPTHTHSLTHSLVTHSLTQG